MLVFVYGTLKKDCCNNHILENIIIEKEISVTTTDKYPMYKSEYHFPYLENQPGEGDYITGELYEIDENKIHILDKFEGVPDLFKKGKIDVEFENIIYEDVNCYFRSEETDLSDKKLIDEWTE